MRLTIREQLCYLENQQNTQAIIACLNSVLHTNIFLIVGFIILIYLTMCYLLKLN
jgi:hypothetical protein